jgi:hypothetical protein
MNYTEQEKKQARHLLEVLQSIKNGKPLFFNVVTYEKLGLIKENTERITLTEKSLQLLRSIEVTREVLK